MASSGNFVINVDSNVEISRGAEPEYHLDFSKIENLVVYNEKGESIRVGDIYKHQKTIIILVRHFLCFACKEYVDDLALIPDSHLQDAGVQLVVIGCAHPKFIRPFRMTTGYSLQLYVDPSRTLYKALGCNEKLGKFPSKTIDSKHVKSGFFSGVFKSMMRGMQYREMQGDHNQQGGSFIFGPGDVVHFMHCDSITVDHAPINDLLDVAGVEQVSFEKDKRMFPI